MDKITVITLTRRRRELKRAIASVYSQDYTGGIDHLIIVDDCRETFEALNQMRSSPRVRIIPHLELSKSTNITSEYPGLDQVYSKIARLLNLGIGLADSRWVAFLDDDNEYEINHLSSLVNCAIQNDCAAVHSYRSILNADGSPYLETRFPWTRDREKAASIYELLCMKGVWVRNSNILKDRAGPFGFSPFRNSTILSPEGVIFLVDTSVWLLERDLCLKFPVPENFSEKDLEDNNAPDDKFLELLLENKIPIVATGLPTLRYYLGGVSN